MLVLVVAQTFVIAVLALLVVGLLRSHAEILRALHDLGAGIDGHAGRGPSRVELRTRPGVPEPRDGDTTPVDVAGVDPEGDAIAVGVVDVGHATLLAFLTSGCTTCSAFWDAFADRHLSVPGGARLVIVTRSPEEESVSRLRTLVPANATVVMSTNAWREYNVPGSPYFILIDGRRGRIVGEGSGTSWAQVETFLREAVADAGGDQPERGRSGAERRERIDEELARAGIEPGHPSLYPKPRGDRGDDA